MILAGTLVPIIAAGVQFACTPVQVWDGDGPIWCAEGPHVRIANIAARELDGNCLHGHPCPDASGIAARDALVELLGGARGAGPRGHVLVDGPTMQCVSEGHALGNRTAARCELPDGRSLGDELIRRRVALRWEFDD